MKNIAKWIGGTTAVSLALIGSMVFGAQAVATPTDEVEASATLVAEDVLDTAATSEELPLPEILVIDPDSVHEQLQPAVAEAPAFTSEEVVQAIPPYDPDNPFVIKRILPIEGPIRYGEWHWDDEGIPDGPLVVTVDLQARVISVFRDGYEIGAAAALLGTDTHPTPVGTFPILTKERHNVSEKYNNAPMPWTLRLTWDGVAIHGGSQVQRGYASHGCIGVPDEFASRLFAIAKRGDRVIITDGVMTGIGGSLGG